MVAGRERQHGHRVPRIDQFQTRLLPVAAIFGGNASGKTNFFRALSFARSLVVDGTSQPGQPIPVEPFRLDEESEARPSRFSFELLVEDSIYSYSFSLTPTEVEDEELRVQTSAVKRTLYVRRRERIQFHRSLPRIDELKMASRLTRDNQLFLTASLAHNVRAFHSIYRWFDECLELIAPDCRFASVKYLTDEVAINSSINEVLSQLDLGLVRVNTQEVLPESFLSKRMIAEIQKTLKARQSAIVGAGTSSRYLVTRLHGRLSAQKLVTYHRRSHGPEVMFEFADESDGSQRVIDLLPVFLDLASSECDKTYAIDEFGRSLHPILTRWLLEHYLDRSSKSSRSQLLIATHDAQLIDQSLLRRDEMWVTETDSDGASHLISFSEYKGLRKDKDILKAYVQGRVGGIPKIFA